MNEKPLFPEIKLTRADRKKVTHLQSWHTLNELFLLGVTETEVKKLILLELEGAARRTIVNRLVARLGKLNRKQILESIYS